jgi:hypothetical protein
VAVARDDQGREVARARQWINVPRPPAEARIVVDRDGLDGPPVAQVAWNSAMGGQPRAVRATLDGEPVEVADPARIPLPGGDPDSVHFLRVELEFAGGVSASAEVAFGGRHGALIGTDVTGIPIWLEGPRRSSPATLRDVLFTRDGPLEVVGVEKGLANVVLVPDLGSGPLLLALEKPSRRSVRVGSRWISAAGGNQRFAGSFPRDLRLRILWPLVETRPLPQGSRSLLRPSPEMSPWEAGLLPHLRSFRPPVGGETERVADAVAMAGLMAAEPGRRRAVVVVLSGETEDASHLTPDGVLRFLDQLGVPLFVWRVGEDPVTGAWGPPEPVTSLRRLERSLDRIGEVLARQRVAWVAAAVLPRDVGIRPAAGVARVGVAPFLEGLPPEGPLDPEELDDPTADELAIGAAPASRPEPTPLDPERLAEALAAMEGPVSRSRLGPFEVHYDLEVADPVLDLAPVAAALETSYRDRYGVDPGAGSREAVVLFARESSYRAYVGDEVPDDEEIAGHAGGGIAVVLVGDRDRDQVRALFVHELTHLLNRRAFGPRLPPWLEEGLADEPALGRYRADGRPLVGTYWGETRVSGRSVQDRQGGIQGIVRREGSVGALHDLAWRALRGGLVALPDLLAMEWEPFLRPEGRTLRYAQSAFFVRYLIEGRRPQYRDGFRRFLRSVAEGGPSGPGALEEALGDPLATVEAGFRSWLRFQQATLRLKGE